jgi:hypothetical protein
LPKLPQSPQFPLNTPAADEWHYGGSANDGALAMTAILAMK